MAQFSGFRFVDVADGDGIGRVGLAGLADEVLRGEQTEQIAGKARCG
jgi:hypothetical protein